MKLAYHGYTARGRRADGLVGRQLEAVCGVLLRRIPKVESIILTGGFARGEGPVKVKGGRIYPYNDYDITVVSKSHVGKEEADRIATEASEAIGGRGMRIFYPFRKAQQRLEDNFYVDLKVVAEDELKSSVPRIRNYELRNHGLVLYGSDARKLVPGFSLKDIPLAEGAKLLLDRMSQLAEYFSAAGEHDDEVVAYFIQQAYAACCTSLLMLSGKYGIGYAKSARVLSETYGKDFPELAEKVPDLAQSVRKYVGWKIRPEKVPDRDITGAWFKARDDIMQVSMYFFGRFTGRGIRDVAGLRDAIRRMEWEFHGPFLSYRLGKAARALHPLAKLYLKYRYFKRVKSQRGIFLRHFLSGKSPDVLIFSSVPAVIMSLRRDGKRLGVDAALFSDAVKSLRKVYPQPGRINGWDGLTLYYAEAYIAFFLQKIG